MSVKNESKFRYFQGLDKEGRVVVVAKLVDSHRDAYESIVKITHGHGIGFGMKDNEDFNALVMQDVFVGKAVCSKEDEFDFEVGAKIARNRALEKYYREKGRVVSQWITVAEERMSKLAKLEGSIYSKYYIYEDHNFEVLNEKSEG